MRAAPLGKPGHAALKGVAVQVRHAGEGDGVPLVTGRRRTSGSTEAIRPSATVTRTSRRQPSGVSAVPKKSPAHTILLTGDTSPVSHRGTV